MRAGVLRPAPAPVDRVRGRLEQPYDGRARAECRTSAADATRARWRQYRAIWAFVESGRCRRAAVLRHFGDRAAARTPQVACCDVCAPEAIADVMAVAAAAARERPRARRAPRARRPPRAAPAVDGETQVQLDEAIFDVVGSAEPAVGRTRAVQILRGGRSKVVEQHCYDELPAYGAFAHAARRRRARPRRRAARRGPARLDRRALPEARAGARGGVSAGAAS